MVGCVDYGEIVCLLWVGVGCEGGCWLWWKEVKVFGGLFVGERCVWCGFFYGFCFWLFVLDY